MADIYIQITKERIQKLDFMVGEWIDLPSYVNFILYGNLITKV